MTDRTLTYAEAIREALHQAMDRDPSVVLLGQGVAGPKRIYGTTAGLLEAFGPERVIETPLAEDGMTGAAVGMALAGLRPVMTHIRMDFLLLAMNQLVNVAAKVRYMSGGRCRVPLVIRAIAGRGWGQGAQHSQALPSWLMNVPGLRVAAPATPADVWGVLTWALLGRDPTVIMEHRALYQTTGLVSEEQSVMAPGPGWTCDGRDVTVVGVSQAAWECFRAKVLLEKAGVWVSAEVIDPVWLSPLEMTPIIASVRKTGRLLVVDCGWTTCGVGAEILAQVGERVIGVSMRRMGLAPCPCPTTPALERLFYPDARRIASVAYEMVTGKAGWEPTERLEAGAEFKGPF